MKNLKYFAGFFSGLIAIIIILLLVTYVVPDPFGQSYQRAIRNQYDYYQTIEENKIVFIGGSSLSFGLDLDLMEELTGETCAILGNHAGLGLSYLVNLSKSNLKSGDTVVIEFENDTAETVGTELLLTLIGNRIGMYQYIPVRHWDNVAMGYGTYIEKKIFYWLQGGYTSESEIYSIEAFDERGNMTYYRECILPDGPFTGDIMEFPMEYDEGFISFLNEYVDYCNSIGVNVYFTRPCYLDESVQSTEEEIALSDSVLQELLDAPLISDWREYSYSREYMYNGYRHCNTAGAEKRTRQLYEDLCEYAG